MHAMISFSLALPGTKLHNQAPECIEYQREREATASKLFWSSGPSSFGLLHRRPPEQYRILVQSQENEPEECGGYEEFWRMILQSVTGGEELCSSAGEICVCGDSQKSRFYGWLGELQTSFRSNTR